MIWLAQYRVHRCVRAVCAACLCALLCLTRASGVTATENFGKPGEPITLSVGYQPYFTESWSGVVVRALKLDEKYLPPGSHVDYLVGISGGGVLLKSLQAGETQLSYLGLMPTVTGASNQQIAQLRIVAVAGQSDDLCNQILIRADYPLPASNAEAFKWLANKNLGVPAGTCADLFTTHLLSAQHLHAANVYDQNFDLLSTSFRIHAIDAATIWEPAASALVDAGLARRLLSGSSVGESSASFIVVRADLLQQRPDVVQAWLRAEREAQAFIANPANADRVVAMVQAQTSHFSAAVLRRALYGDAAAGAAPPRIRFPFVIRADVRQLLSRTARFLFDNQKVPTPQLSPQVLQPQLAAALLPAAEHPIVLGAR